MHLPLGEARAAAVVLPVGEADSEMDTSTIAVPENFLKEEERSGYTVSEQMKKVWAVELDLLDEFDRVCRENGLSYWADGGTLLGAVRHKGFIPWDDDMDLLMLRRDYDRLCQIAPQAFRAPYFWQTDETDAGFQRGFARLRNCETTALLSYEEGKHYRFNQGIFIDISPLDNLPDSPAERSAFRRSVKRRWDLCRALCNFTVRYNPESTAALSLPKRLLKHAGHGLCRFLPGLDYQRAFRRYQNCCRRYGREQVKQVGVAYYDFDYVFDREIFDRTVCLPFEDRMIPVPENYEQILREYYGDYTVPREGTAFHEVVLFDTERPYTDYI